MMTQDRAEIVALRALAWLGEAELLDAFLGATGTDEATLRAGAATPEVLAGVMDFVLSDDAWARGVAEAQDLPPEALMQARAALPGGDLPHWT